MLVGTGAVDSEVKLAAVRHDLLMSEASCWDEVVCVK